MAMKLKFNSIVAPLRKLLIKLEAYFTQCEVERVKNIERINAINLENQMIAEDAQKTADTITRLKHLVGDSTVITEAFEETAEGVDDTTKTTDV